MFRVTLSNFQKLAYRQVTFNSGELIRIFGESEQGKSTLFRAIIWALYACPEGGKPIPKHMLKNKVPNVPMVELIYQDEVSYLRIVRQKTSDQLIVWITPDHSQPYYDTTAQAIIDRMWGSADHLCGMYLPQKRGSLFNNMNDLEKSTFLLRLQFRSQDLELLRNKLENKQKYLVNEHRIQQTIYQRDISIFQTQFEQSRPDYSKIMPVDQVQLVRDKIQQLQNEIPILQQQIKSVSFSTSYQEQRQALLKRREELRSQLLSDTEYVELSDLVSKSNHLQQTEIINLPLDKLEEVAARQKIFWDWLMSNSLPTEPWSNTLLTNLQQRWLTDKDIRVAKQFYNDLLNKIKPYSSLAAYQNAYNVYKRKKSRYDDLAKIEFRTLEQIKEARDKNQLQRSKLEMAMTVKVCPNCNTSLIIQNDNLVSVNINNAEKSHQECKTQINKLDEWFLNARKHEELIHEFEQLKTFMTEQPQTWLSDVELNQLQSEYHKHEKYFNSNPSLNITSIPEVQLDIFNSRPEIIVNSINVKKYEEQYNVTLSEIRNKVHKHNNVKHSLQEIENQLNAIPANNEYNININELESKLSNNNNELNQYRIITEQSHLANTFYQRQLDLQKMATNVTILAQQVQMTALILDKYKVFANQRLENIVLILNGIISKMTPICFPNTNIEIKLNLTKQLQNKTTTHKINLEIIKNEVEYSLQHDLCGGEYDRVNLILTIAFSHVVPGKILCIDEPLTSLPADFQLSILKRLREFLPPNKIWLVANHHTETGLFDNMYTV